MRKTLRPIAMVVLLAAISAGCGESDSDDGLSKAEFLKQGNAICKEGNEKFEALFANFPVTQGALADFFGKARPILEGQAKEMRALEPPSDDEATVEAIFEAFDRSVEDFKKAEADPAFASELFGAEGGENTKEAEKKADAYGLTACNEEEDEEGEEFARLDPSAFPAEKQEYIAKADAICKAANDKFRPIEATAFEAFPPPLDKWAEFLPKVIATYRPAVAELRELEPPVADRATVTGLLDSLSAVLDTFEAGGKLAAAGDEARFAETMSPAFGESEEVDAAFVAYGFQVCGPDDEANDDEE